jgi:acyl carrier protein
MRSFPTYDEFLTSLSQKAGGLDVDEDSGIFQQPNLDSVDVVEWLYALEDNELLEFNQEASELIGTKTVRELYQMFSDVHNATQER